MLIEHVQKGRRYRWHSEGADYTGEAAEVGLLHERPVHARGMRSRSVHVRDGVRMTKVVRLLSSQEAMERLKRDDADMEATEPVERDRVVAAMEITGEAS